MPLSWRKLGGEILEDYLWDCPGKCPELHAGVLKSARVAVMFCATVVNTQTQTDRRLLTGYKVRLGMVNVYLYSVSS